MQKFGNKIIKIIKIDRDDFKIQIKFADHSIGWVNLKSIFHPPKGLASEVLKGNIFEKCFIDSGALAWPNGLELCPDSLKLMMDAQNKKSKGAA